MGIEIKKTSSFPIDKDKPIPVNPDEIQPVFPNDPGYPPKDDIYEVGTKMDSPALDQSATIENVDDSGIKKELKNNRMGEQLDVPGSELDDAAEDTGNEDEENNYYSIGGDGHSNLDEEGA